MRHLHRAPSRRSRGQAVVEFSFAVVPFVLILMGIFDLGRGIYMSSGTSQAAREIARVTAVHQGAPLGASVETLGVISTQQRLVPGLGDADATISITCTTMGDAAVAVTPSTGCPRSDFVKVTVTVPFSVITPLLSMVAPTTLTATAHIQVP
jgi:Flp pilus assembly protein TadG